jgi:hypothetical protein
MEIPKSKRKRGQDRRKSAITRMNLICLANKHRNDLNFVLISTFGYFRPISTLVIVWFTCVPVGFCTDPISQVVNRMSELRLNLVVVEHVGSSSLQNSYEHTCYSQCYVWKIDSCCLRCSLAETLDG